MAENTQVQDLTAAADEAAIEKAEALAEQAASDLYTLFDEDKSTFTRAKRIMKWLDKGADVKLVASHLSAQRAGKAFPEAEGYSDEERRAAADLPPSKGGVKVADSTIRAYATAWQAVYDAQLVPNELNVAGAFKVKSKGRTATPLKRLIEEVAAAIESESVTQEQGSAAFVEGCKGILSGRIESEPSKPRARKEGSDEETEVSLPEDVPMSIEVAIHNLKVIFGQAWNDDERVVLAAEASALLEALAPIEV